MKVKQVIFCLILLINKYGKSQPIVPGLYGENLLIAFDSSSQIITGHFADYSGWNEVVQAPQFSCYFYFQGKRNDSMMRILSYYPEKIPSDSVYGELTQLGKNRFRLGMEHNPGGCWNVTSFSNDLPDWELMEPLPIKQIRYVIKPKSYFVVSTKNPRKRKSYLVSSDCFLVIRLEGKWAYGMYYGNEKPYYGYIDTNDLNNWDTIIQNPL